MFKKIILVSGLSAVLLAASGTSFAADQDRDQLRDQDMTHTSDQIYGSDMMTSQERAEFRSQMQAAKSAEERMRMRNEHHEQMKMRAQERGLKMPEEPPAMHQRKNGMGNGMGNGMRNGNGMGNGMGNDRKCGGGGKR